MSKTRSVHALDALAFLAPDVQGGIGPFLVIFMSTALHWDAGRVGTVMFASALVGLLLQAPAGALVDQVRSMPRWIAGSLGVIALSVLAMALLPTYPVILLGQSVIGVAAAIVAPALAAVSLGLVGRNHMELRLGRNAALTAAGTVTWAVSTGVIGHLFGPRSMFVYAIAMGIPAMIAALSIRNADIDAKLARGADRDNETEGNTGGERWYDRRLIVLCVCAFLFHLANAAMLTLVAQQISQVTGNRATLYMSASLVVTQLMTIGIGLAVGRFAQKLPRKPIFLVAFAVLPVRGLLYLTVHQPIALVALQVLDGIGAGIFGVMLILMIGDLTRGSGRFNLGQGIAATAVGAGAAFSNLLAGTVAKHAGYASSFITLAAIAALALALFASSMRETRVRKQMPEVSSVITV